MHWLVTWIVVNSFIVACPPPTAVPDAYGREPMVTAQLSVLCIDTDEKTMLKHFGSREEAEKFHAEGVGQCSECKDWQVFPVQSGFDDILEHFPNLPDEELVVEEG